MTLDEYTVIRKTYWDKKEDQKRIKSNSDNRDALLEAWPSIKTTNIAVRQNNIVLDVIHGMDKLIGDGIVLSPRGSAFPFWKDIALTRRFDWGEVRYCWGASQQNAILENYIIDAMEKLEKAMIDEQSFLAKMVLDYQILPKTFHNAVIGEV
jgi:hypothetical protein